jgi:pimeloyl-ACP methyl ester carboxylesterase
MLVRFFAFSFVLLSAQSAFALSDDANPWLAIDMATCMAHRGADYASAIGASVDVQISEMQGAVDGLPTYCRIAGRIDADIGFEIRLPLEWNRRLLTAGCGLLCGKVEMHRTDDALIRGYAVAHTDMGHQSDNIADASFSYNNRKAEIDFNHRATHLTTALLKATAAQHYEATDATSYFRGCSTGGRQALEAAMRFPDDYDGIIAGAPAAGMIMPHILWSLEAATHADGSSVFTGNALAILQGAALAACDEQDGLSDGIISDPESCDFDPANVQCKPGQSRGCLSSEQVATARAMYQGARTSDDRAVTSMGYSMGDEPGWGRTYMGADGGPPGGMSTKENFFRYVAYDQDPSPDTPLDSFTYDFDVDPWRLGTVHYMPEPEGGYSLARFKARGGKLLLYHGWNDETLTPASSLDYYAEQTVLLGGTESVDPFFRLFMIPGMRHCGSGPGAEAVDYLSAIEDWTEGGSAPEKLIALKLDQSMPNFVRARVLVVGHIAEEILFGRHPTWWTTRSATLAFKVGSMGREGFMAFEHVFPIENGQTGFLNPPVDATLFAWVEIHGRRNFAPIGELRHDHLAVGSRQRAGAVTVIPFINVAAFDEGVDILNHHRRLLAYGGCGL